MAIDPIHIAGVDEAGRGPLAGPVVAGAVMLPKNHGIEGLRDSKKLSPKRRLKVFTQIIDSEIQFSVGIVEPKDIDRTNILVATDKAMKSALGQLKPKPKLALIDGYGLKSQIIPNKGIVDGDQKIESIMAASIVAKVTRDKIMDQYDIIFPDYGFCRNKGYGTPEHLAALKKVKASPIHRKSFKPVKSNLPSIKWMKNNAKIGPLGEQLVALKLLNDGITIRAMNKHCGHHGEIDIIGEKDGTLLFVEVKTTTQEQMGGPLLKVDQQKIKKLDDAIHYFLQKNALQNTDIRFDVTTVVLGKGKPKISSVKGVTLD